MSAKSLAAKKKFTFASKALAAARGASDKNELDLFLALIDPARSKLGTRDLDAAFDAKDFPFDALAQREGRVDSIEFLANSEGVQGGEVLVVHMSDMTGVRVGTLRFSAHSGTALNARVLLGGKVDARALALIGSFLMFLAEATGTNIPDGLFPSPVPETFDFAPITPPFAWNEDVFNSEFAALPAAKTGAETGPEATKVEFARRFGSLAFFLGRHGAFPTVTAAPNLKGVTFISKSAEKKILLTEISASVAPELPVKAQDELLLRVRVALDLLAHGQPGVLDVEATEFIPPTVWAAAESLKLSYERGVFTGTVVDGHVATVLSYLARIEVVLSQIEYSKESSAEVRFAKAAAMRSIAPEPQAPKAVVSVDGRVLRYALWMYDRVALGVPLLDIASPKAIIMGGLTPKFAHGETASVTQLDAMLHVLAANGELTLYERSTLSPPLRALYVILSKAGSDARLESFGSAQSVADAFD